MAATAAVAACVLLGGIWLLRAFDPNTAGSFFPSCLFHDITGWYCPGCGITRALHALVHFDLWRAVAMNALVVLSLPLLALMALQGAMQRRWLPSAVQRTVFDGRWWIGALLVFGIARNLPGLEWLAPGGLL
ncbi:DUF2752 domain-containing protein [Lysobacter terrestris]|uniref:DUF2752 domain-containing protein n=2 Tax=Agrilutibacter terrestris TaxID=2865112 RepID=A0A7H0G1D6_9GAMM|nr:DUF2752 domain-containing protein [Lysobacter terrestris]QNP42102.1 DUF2752 domain-containing protein [Lysobacter terrestris]